MVENFCSRASPTRSREREEEGSSWRLGLRKCRGEATPCPPYIGGWPPPLSPPPSPRAASPRVEWGESFPPPSRRSPVGFTLGLAGWAYGALCPWPKAARALPL